MFMSVDPLAEQFPGWNPYHYVHNNPINLIDPTGMSAVDYNQDPQKQQSSEPKKLLNIKLYGTDKSLYYDGEAYSFGSGGFNFTTEKESRGDSSLLVGNSGQGEYVNADPFVQAADFSKSFSKGTNFGSNKGIVEYLGNIIEGLNKGMNVGDKINEISKTSNTSTANQSSSNGQSEMVTMQRTDYSATKPYGNTNSVFHTPPPRDTMANRRDAPIVRSLNTRDSINALKMEKFYNQSR